MREQEICVQELCPHEVKVFAHFFLHEGRLVEVKLRQMQKEDRGVWKVTGGVLCVEEWIYAYFRGGKLPELPLYLSFSGFTNTVLEKTIHIPIGVTWSYKELASAIGNPRASRAVAKSLSCNLIPLVIPCHRVIRSSGDIGGFSAADLIVKEELIALERKLCS